MNGQERRPYQWRALLDTALHAGISVREFWGLTPLETYASVQAAQWRWDREARMDARLAWHTAVLVRTKSIPPLRSLLAPPVARVLEGKELEKRRAERDEMLRRMPVEAINKAARRGRRG